MSSEPDGVMSDAELQAWATGLMREHDPANQGHGYERCALCHFTRHPCDAYDAAFAILGLLERVSHV